MPTAPGDQSPEGTMRMDLESLRAFEKSIREVLKDFADYNVRDPVAGYLKPSHYGTGFNEAYAVALASGFTVMDIKRFADMLHKQIEAMELTVRMAADSTLRADRKASVELARLIQGKPGERPYTIEPTTQADASPTRDAAQTD